MLVSDKIYDTLLYTQQSIFLTKKLFYQNYFLNKTMNNLAITRRDLFLDL